MVEVKIESPQDREDPEGRDQRAQASIGSIYFYHPSLKKTRDSFMDNHRARTGRCGYGYFAEYPYSELLEKFRLLLDQRIKPEPIFSFADERERICTLFRFPGRNASLRNEPNVIYSRRRKE